MSNKLYKIIRIVEEIYEVSATSKQDALRQEFSNPSSVKIIREKAVTKIIKRKQIIL